MRLFVSVICLFFSSSIFASDYYLRGGVGSATGPETVETVFNVTEWNYDDGFNVSVAVGKYMSETFSAEIEYMYQEFDGDERIAFPFGDTAPLSGKMYSNNLMLNLLYRPKNGALSSKINPYFGIGMGVSKVSSTKIIVAGGGGGYIEHDNDVVPAAQIILGNRFEWQNDWFLDAEYRYFEVSGYGTTDVGGNRGHLNDHHSHIIGLFFGKNF